jgi:hypothetical protein
MIAKDQRGANRLNEALIAALFLGTLSDEALTANAKGGAG